MGDYNKILVSNLNENIHLDISIITCRLYDLMDSRKEFRLYTIPIYTKLDGVYGYLSVSGHKVFFFWYNHSTENICSDDVSDKFKIEYVIENATYK